MHRQFTALVLGLGLALWPRPSPADTTYPLLSFDRSEFIPAYDTIEEFKDTLRALTAEGAFNAAADMSPRAELENLSPKHWLLRNVFDRFQCRRDFGGVCPAGADVPGMNIRRFLAVFASAPIVPSDAELKALSIDTSLLTKPEKVLSREGHEACTPAARADGLGALVSGLAASRAEDELLILDRLRGVLGRYNFRAAPDIAAPVLTVLKDPILYFPDPRRAVKQVRAGAAPLYWREVILPDGRTAHVAPAPGALIDAGGLQSRICYEFEDGYFLYSSFIGGGD